jgi:hypothetical protein
MATLRVSFKIKIYFIAFGLCEHDLSCQILKETFSDYEITWSNEGY